jgi:hypothetical protein
MFPGALLLRRGFNTPAERKSTPRDRHQAIDRTCISGGIDMQIALQKLRLAQAEVHRTAHDQDLIEVPRRARLDREAEAEKLAPAIPVLENR